MKWPWSKKRDYYIETYRDDAGEWRWRLRCHSNALIPGSQGYSRKIDCYQTVGNLAGETGMQVIEVVKHAPITGEE